MYWEMKEIGIEDHIHESFIGSAYWSLMEGHVGSLDQILHQQLK